MNLGSPSAGVALALLLAGPLARAAPESPDRHGLAVESFHQAEAAFARREYAAAAAAFEAAARFEPHPSPWLDAEEAWEKAGDLVHAAEDCDAVLAIPGAAASFRDEAERRLARLAPKLAEVALRGPRELAARVDGGPELVPPARRRLAPGAHAIVVTDSVTGRQASLSLTLAAGETRAVDLAASLPAAVAPVSTAPAPASALAPTAPLAPSEERRAGPPVAVVVAFGLGGAAAVVTGIFGGLTLERRADFDATPTSATADAFHRDKLVTNVALGAAIAGVGAGIVLWALAPRARKAAAFAPASLALRF